MRDASNVSNWTLAIIFQTITRQVTFIHFSQSRLCSAKKYWTFLKVNEFENAMFHRSQSRSADKISEFLKFHDFFLNKFHIFSHRRGRTLSTKKSSHFIREKKLYSRRGKTFWFWHELGGCQTFVWRFSKSLSKMFLKNL